MQVGDGAGNHAGGVLGVGYVTWSCNHAGVVTQPLAPTYAASGDGTPPPAETYALGVDVARSGVDESVLALLKGDTLVQMDSWRGQDTMRTAAKVKDYWDRYSVPPPPAKPDPLHPSLVIAVDDGGVGGGVVDRLREMNIIVRGVSFGAAPNGRMQARFKNKVSQIYWVLAEELHHRKLRISASIPERTRAKLWAQLTQIEWELESDKVIRVHKLGLDGRSSSPDLADALALAVEAQKNGLRVVGFY